MTEILGHGVGYWERVGGKWLHVGGAPSRKHTSFGDCPVPEQPHQFVCQVIAPGDGDTCTVRLELVGRLEWPVTARYEHCFAPERSQTGGVSTANYNASLVGGKWGTFLTKGRFDQRSRLIGDLFVYQGKGIQLLDVSKAVQQFVTDNGFGPGNG